LQRLLLLVHKGAEAPDRGRGRGIARVPAAGGFNPQLLEQYLENSATQSPPARSLLYSKSGK